MTGGDSFRGGDPAGAEGGSPLDIVERFSQALLIGTLIADEGRIVGCDRKLAEALELRPDSLSGAQATELVVPDQRALLTDRLRRQAEDWYRIDLVAASGRVVPAIAIPGYVECSGRMLHTAVFLKRGSVREIETQLLHALESAVSALSYAIEARDPYTAGHQSRVSGIGALLCQEMGLPGQAHHNVVLGGLLHDIGKISIPVEILVKPARLTEAEWSVMKAHPVIGADIIRNVDCPAEVKKMVRHHHERLDGSGYPDGLGGDSIPMDIRVLAVSDALDAIAGVRPYHAQRTMADAIEILSTLDAAYDIEVLAAVKSLHKRGLLEPLAFAGSNGQ